MWKNHAATILDVREPHEWAATGVLPGSTLIALGELPRSLESLDIDAAVLVVCRSGNRSQTAAAFLIHSGFTTVGNLAGGILAVAKA